MHKRLSELISELRERLKPAKDRFALNAYRFASKELERQKAAGFPILDLVSSQLSHNYRILLLGMSPERRASVLEDALSWRHKEALMLMGKEVPSARDAYLSELFNSCLQPSEEEAAKHGYLRPWDRPRTKLNRTALWKALKPEMARITGDSGEAIPGGERWYRTAWGQWSVQTCLDAGGLGGGIRLWHDIWAARHLEVARQLSILSLLGFTFGAEWTQAGAGDEEGVAACVTAVCERFIDARPELLQGVTHDITPDELEQYEKDLAEDSRRRKEKWEKFGRPSPRSPRGRRS